MSTLGFLELNIIDWTNWPLGAYRPSTYRGVINVKEISSVQGKTKDRIGRYTEIILNNGTKLDVDHEFEKVWDFMRLEIQKLNQTINA